MRLLELTDAMNQARVLKMIGVISTFRTLTLAAALLPVSGAAGLETMMMGQAPAAALPLPVRVEQWKERYQGTP